MLSLSAFVLVVVVLLSHSILRCVGSNMHSKTTIQWDEKILHGEKRPIEDFIAQSPAIEAVFGNRDWLDSVIDLGSSAVYVTKLSDRKYEAIVSANRFRSGEYTLTLVFRVENDRVHVLNTILSH